MNKNVKMFITSRYAAQSKADATPTVTPGVDRTSPRVHAAPIDDCSSRTRPPVTIRRTCVEVTVRTVVVASTQELERPFINTVVVGGAGAVI